MHDYKFFAMGYLNMEKKWMFPLVLSSLVCIFLLATSFNMGLLSSLSTMSLLSMFPSRVMTNVTASSLAENQVPPPPARPPVPKFAYLISGSRGDLEKLWRTLHALYHPWNYYVVHLDLESPVEERFELGSRVEKHPIFAKRHKDWDWFINLSASDYPLVTQDDLLDTFSDLKRELNFIEHTSHLGWKAGQRAMPLIVDPGLYQTANTAYGVGIISPELCSCITQILFRPQKAISRLLSAMPQNSSPTVVNHDMHYISWDSPKQHPHTLTLNDTAKMIASDAAFARKFKQDTPILDKIDRELLGRKNGSFTPGGWCGGKPRCSKVRNPTKLRPGPGAERLRRLIGFMFEARTMNKSFIHLITNISIVKTSPT
ncbi:hypothetical protein DH2020_033571 [Rehmannia glutinosa]|uniref:Uncharacterized protein n=1 Tax=Rehmannia glutinosa TaxID=99300 RepID=A0ABR0VCC1_REHGL